MAAVDDSRGDGGEPACARAYEGHGDRPLAPPDPLAERGPPGRGLRHRRARGDMAPPRTPPARRSRGGAAPRRPAGGRRGPPRPGPAPPRAAPPQTRAPAPSPPGAAPAPAPAPP